MWSMIGSIVNKKITKPNPQSPTNQTLKDEIKKRINYTKWSKTKKKWNQKNEGESQNKK